MLPPMETQHPVQADAEKRRAALSSVLWSLFLTLLKLATGLATNSLGLLSEALHSALDLVAAGITYCAVRMAARPADRSHAYGYGKVENLSALIETMLLLLTCVWIVYEAVNRLFFSSPEVRHSWWGVGVILISVAVDFSRARMLKRVARKHNSQALEADALHFSTDILSSIVVLAGLLGLWAASLLPSGLLRSALEKTDALAALVVSAIVIRVGATLAHRAVHVLLDGGSRDFLEPFERALQTQLPLYRVDKLRVRQSGAAIFADVTLRAPGELTLEESHHISTLVETIAREIHAGADVIVQLEPASETEHGLLATVHAMATAHGLSVHSLMLDDHQAGKLCAYLHVEAPGNLSLREAHRRVDAFEQALETRAGVEHVISHIEPDERFTPDWKEPDAVSPLPFTEAEVKAALSAPPELPEPHDVEIRRIYGLLTLSLHCSVSGDLTVSQAHDLAATMERRLRAHLAGIDRVNIHMEPEPEAFPKPGDRPADGPTAGPGQAAS